MKNASIQDKPTAHLNSFSQELDNSVTDERDNFHDIQIQVMSTEHDDDVGNIHINDQLRKRNISLAHNQTKNNLGSSTLQGKDNEKNSRHDNKGKQQRRVGFVGGDGQIPNKRRSNENTDPRTDLQSISSERQLLHRNIQQHDLGDPSGGSSTAQIRLGSVGIGHAGLHQYQQQTGSRAALTKSKGKDLYNKSGSISRNPPTSVVLDMQETLPLDQMHLEKSNLNGRMLADDHQQTLRQRTDKHQVGDRSKASESSKNQSVVSFDRSTIGPTGTSIALSEAVKRHNR